MDLGSVAALFSSVLGGIFGVLIGAWKVGRRTEAVTRDLDDLKKGHAEMRTSVLAQDLRIVQLEQSRAVTETRMDYMKDLLEEIRSDVKDMKGR